MDNAVTVHAAPACRCRKSLSIKEFLVLAASYPFLDVLWSMVIFFLFIIWIWILIKSLRRHLPPP